MRAFWKKEDASIEVIHYAPDITLTAVDYVIPVSLEQRIRRAEANIRDFLSQANPDNLCESFYDSVAEKEEQLIISQVLEQMPGHLDACRSIAEKHHAELRRLDLALEQIEETIRDYGAEIASLQELFDHCNKMG